MAHSFDTLKGLNIINIEEQTRADKSSSLKYVEHYSVALSENRERIQSLKIKVDIENVAISNDEASELIKAYYRPYFKERGRKHVLVHKDANPSRSDFERFNRNGQIVTYNRGHLKGWPKGSLLVFKEVDKHPFWDYLIEYVEAVWRHICEYIKYKRPYIKSEDPSSEVETATLVELKFQRSFNSLEFLIRNRVSFFELNTDKRDILFPLKFERWDLDQSKLFSIERYKVLEEKNYKFWNEDLDLFLLVHELQKKSYGIQIPSNWLIIEVAGGAAGYRSTLSLVGGNILSYTIYGQAIYTLTGIHRTEYRFYKKPTDMKVKESLPDYPGLRFLSEGYFVPGAGSVIDGELFSDNSTVSNFEIFDAPQTLLNLFKENNSLED